MTWATAMQSSSSTAAMYLKGNRNTTRPGAASTGSNPSRRANADSPWRLSRVSWCFSVNDSTLNSSFIVNLILRKSIRSDIEYPSHPGLGPNRINSFGIPHLSGVLHTIAPSRKYKGESIKGEELYASIHHIIHRRR